MKCPTSYSLGPVLCASSHVSRVVGNQIRPQECFESHANVFHELTMVNGAYSSDGSMGITSYTLQPMLCSSSNVSRIVGNEISPHNYSNRMFPWSRKFLSSTYKCCRYIEQ